MKSPQAFVDITPEGGPLHPGQRMTGHVRFKSSGPVSVQRVRVTAVWTTEGKGDQDSGEVGSKTWPQCPPLDELGRIAFDLQLPLSPWSYRGTLIKISWHLLVDVEFADRTTVQVMQPFELRPVGAGPVSAG